MAPADVFKAEIPNTEAPVLNGVLLWLVADPFLKKGASFVTGLKGENPVLMGADLNGEMSCPVLDILNPGEPNTVVVPGFNGETLNPEVPAVKPDEMPPPAGFEVFSN